jgi:hypothetical protein
MTASFESFYLASGWRRLPATPDKTWILRGIMRHMRYICPDLSRAHKPGRHRDSWDRLRLPRRKLDRFSNAKGQKREDSQASRLPLSADFYGGSRKRCGP